MLAAAVKDGLAAVADPGRAPKMQAYMKSDMPYLGVAVLAVRAVTKAAAREHPPISVLHLGATAAALWRGATYREHRYAATQLTSLRMADGALALLPLYEEMIVTGAWWDHVDGVAPRLGQLLVTQPASLRPLILAWSRAPDRWLRRASIIAQLGARARTDVDCCRSLSMPTSPTRTSSSARPSAGPFATTPERTPSGSEVSWPLGPGSEQLVPPGSHQTPGLNPSGTFATGRRVW